MTRRRTFTREFKLAIVREILHGDRRPSQICRAHGLHERVVQRWRHEVETRGDHAFTAALAAEGDVRELRIAELERLCGQLTLENSALKKGLSAVVLRNDRP